MQKAMLVSGLLALFATGCGLLPFPGRTPMGVAWGPGSFDTVGEQIYFTGIDAEGERIRYSGGPSKGMMMEGYLSCASCHGPDARGGRHLMHMEVMDAPDIRWSVLGGEGHEEEDHPGDDQHDDAYTIKAFRRAVVEGEHPDGELLSPDMPRWQMSEESLEDLMDYLISLG